MRPQQFIFLLPYYIIDTALYAAGIPVHRGILPKRIPFPLFYTGIINDGNPDLSELRTGTGNEIY